jgi:hypothetical protein
VIYEPVTAGERLYMLLLRLTGRSNWESLRRSFALSCRSDEYVELFQEVMTANLTCRTVSLGRSLAKEMSPGDPVYESELKSALIGTIGIPVSEVATILRGTTDAVKAAEHDFSPREKERLRKAAKLHNVRCYMCGGAIDYDGVGKEWQAYTLEHVWPQSYGGDSIDENALPACHGCNEKKADFATWGMVAVQSLILGLNPSNDKLEEIDKTFKFAMLYRAARRFAHIERCCMSQAFIRLGPWRKAELDDPDELADFFTLRNHRADARLV